MGTWGSIICGAIGAAIGGAIGGPGGAVAGALIGAGAGSEIGGKGKEAELFLRAQRKKVKPDSGSEEIDAIEVEMKGVIVTPKANMPLEFILLAKDCSGGKKFEDGDLVATSADYLCSLGDSVLSPKQEVTLPYEATEYSEWTSAFTIPIDCLVFPYKGARDIEFNLFVQDKKENAYAVASTKINVQVDEIGYMEYGEVWEKSEKMALQIVRTIVFNNSGFFTLDTSRIIKDWIKERQNLRSDSKENEDTGKKLNSQFQAIKKSTSAPQVSAIVFQARELSETVRTADKYAFVEFFLKVVASFENITNDDIKLLDLIATEMSLENKEYQEAKQKYLPIHKIDEADPFLTLGITPSMPDVDKKKKLRELFAKWNALAIHKDPEMRKKAETMLNTIAECQKELRH